MDLGDLLDGFGPDLLRSKRAKGVMRVLFGLLGVGLSCAGAWHMLGHEASLHLRVVAASLFVFMGAFFLANVTLARQASWPWKGFVAAFVLLFAVRILLGP